MKRLALALATVVGGTLLLSDPSDASVTATNGDTVTASGSWVRQEDASQVKAEDAKSGGATVVSREDGDRPSKPALHWSADFSAACVTGLPGVSITFYRNSDPVDIPACAGGAASPPRPSPVEAAYQAWYWETKLPSPTLATSPPAGAVTGLDLYLAIGGPQTMRYDVAAFGYDIRLDVTSVYDVDWGDPSPSNETPLGYAVTRGHRTQGGLWPNGDLRHQYIERGTVTVTVTQRWTARWSGGGQSGTIADRLGTSATLSFPVEEIVAVSRPVQP